MLRFLVVAIVSFSLAIREAAHAAERTFEMPFAAKTQQEALAWQARARSRLMELVTRQVPRTSTQDAPLDVKLGPLQDKGAYSLCTITFQGNKKGKRGPAC